MPLHGLWHSLGRSILFRSHCIATSTSSTPAGRLIRHVLMLWMILHDSSSHFRTTTTTKTTTVQGLSPPPSPQRIYPLGMPPLRARTASSSNQAVGGSGTTGSAYDPYGGRAPAAAHHHPAHGDHHQQDNNSKSAIISSKCSCGSLRIDVPVRYDGQHDQHQGQQHSAQAPPPLHQLIDCHCSACRRYHVSGLVRYLEVSSTSGIAVTGDTAVRFRDTCNTLGTVDRMYCRICSSKLLTTRVVGVGGANHQQPHQQAFYINMGPIDDSTVPDDLAEYWQQRALIQQWNVNMAASWTTAQPLYNNADDDGRSATAAATAAAPSVMRSSGGCTCGSCQYDYRLEAPMEIQHCYCYLCRQLSGGMFMSWVPVKTRRQRFQWDMTSSSSSRRSSVDAPGGAAATDESGRRTAGRHGRQGQAPRTYRYTDIGERHACTVCGGILTILYDHEDTEDEIRATIWLAAGGFDSIRFPFRIEPYLSRAVHICCRYKPKWYALPNNDGLEKIPDAS